MSAQYINYGNFGSWANTVDNRNNKLLDDLHEIQRLIKSLEGEWESNAAVAIRQKIQEITMQNSCVIRRRSMKQQKPQIPIMRTNSSKSAYKESGK